MRMLLMVIRYFRLEGNGIEECLGRIARSNVKRIEVLSV